MSGSSTPRGAITPPPPGGSEGGQSSGPSPLLVGKRFVKAYYEGLSTDPKQIIRFYQPVSVLSYGEGSTPTDPMTFEMEFGEGASGGTEATAKAAEKLKNRFYKEDLQIQFEFEHGAIDAQTTMNGGILLVVTGHVVYFPSADEDEDAAVDDPIRKGFVHTFHLCLLPGSNKRQYYVHNDILRFLKPVSEMLSSDFTSPVPPSSDSVPEPSSVVKKSVPIVEPPVVVTEKQSTTKIQQTITPEPIGTKSTVLAGSTIVKKEVNEAPGGGVEETKDEMLVVLEPLNKKPARKEDKNDSATAKGGKGGPENDSKGKSRSNKPGSEDGDGKSQGTSSAPKPVPGSWASLVAGSAANAAAAPAASSSGPSTTTERSAPPAQVLPPTPQPPAATVSKSKVDNNKAPSSSSANKDGGGHINPNAGNPHVGGGKMGGGRSNKRDPDCTLVIKNLADGTKESDVLGLFEPFAKETKTRVVGITVSAHRGIAFVDYDSIQPVMMAVDLHQKEPMRLLGRTLEVDQKTAEQRARRAAQGGRGGSYRSGSPNNGGNRYGGGGRGGGGGHYNRRGGGRGDRGGGRGGRGGR